MTFDITQAGLASSHLNGREDVPSCFLCKDFTGGQCCEDCHKNGWVIAIYPWSAAHKTAPDLSLGLRAEVCCARFHAVRQLSRAWWIQRYGEKSGWSATDCERLVKAPGESYYKISGEIASKYYVRGNPSTAIRVAAPRVKRSGGKGCPKCGSPWDGIACDSCGHS
jgi:hypothetical protein